MKTWLYRFRRLLVQLIARPTLSGQNNLPPDREVVYVLHHRALTDLIVLDIAADQNDIISPLSPLSVSEREEKHRFFPLLRSAAGRMTMQTYPQRLQRLLVEPLATQATIVLVPVSVFWGRGLTGEGTLLKALTSEHWAVSGRIKRLLNLIINRKNILVHLGRPIALDEVAQGVAPDVAIRRTARLLRVRLRHQKERTLGPDFSHRRTLLHQIVTSRLVKTAMDELIAAGDKPRRVERLAHRYAKTIASDMSHPTIRVLARMLSWFWTKIYDGIDLTGVEVLSATSETHTLVFVPSHRSHLDYLLLSYLLYYQGFMIPHVAAGDNLNLPVLGSVLRRGGAFFMRRSFRGDNLYAAVFDEYLYQVYRRGHCVEFFPEGGRTRTGRLLPVKFGMLKMSLDHQRRGLPKPLAFVPVYFGYEKIIEAASYLSELRGANKQDESLGDLFRNLKLIRQNFGRVAVNIGEPIKFDEWLAQREDNQSDNQLVQALGKQILGHINQQASLNPVNLVALVTLATPKLAIEAHHLEEQIALYQNMVARLYAKPLTTPALPPADIVAHAETLGLLQRDEQEYGTVLSHDPFTAVLMTWYRNNVVHTLTLPALIACLLVRRRRPVNITTIKGLVEAIYPYLAQELNAVGLALSFEHCTAVMIDLGLLSCTGQQLAPPRPDQPEQLRLSLLANLVSQNLERMFIVIHQLSQGPCKREELQLRSQRIAQKISSIYGINAPEFSDLGLFDQLIEGLIDARVLIVDEHGNLSSEDVFAPILRAAEYVIDPHIRYGVLSEVHQANVAL